MDVNDLSSNNFLAYVQQISNLDFQSKRKVQHASFPAVKLTRQFTFVIIGCFDDHMDPVPVCAVCMKHFESATEDHRPHSLPCGHSLCCKCLGMLLFARTYRRTAPMVC